MADAEPRTISVRTINNDSYYNDNGVGVFAFSLEVVDDVTGLVVKGADFSSIYTESLVEIGAIIYPSFMGYILTVDTVNDDLSDVILSIVDHNDDDTVYSAYFDNSMIWSGGLGTFTEGDTPPDPSDDSGEGGD